jgi:hypothetical protein
MVELRLNDVTFSKKRFRTYLGNMGEMIAEEVLIRKGFEVWEVRPYSTGMKEYHGLFYYLKYLYVSKPTEHELKDRYNRFYPPRKLDSNFPSLSQYCSREISAYNEAIKELETFFGNKLYDFKSYVESIGVIGKVGVVGAAQIHREGREVEHIYTPDLVGKKDKDIYIIEVKVNTGSKYFRTKKLQGLMAARNFNLVPLIVNLKLEIQASEFTIHEV